MNIMLAQATLFDVVINLFQGLGLINILGILLALAGLVLILGARQIISLTGGFISIKPGRETLIAGTCILVIGLILFIQAPKPPKYIILAPQNGEVVSSQTAYKEGINFQAKIFNRKPGDDLWLVVNPAVTDQWFPQESIPGGENIFTTKVFFGNDKGTDYINIVRANKKASQVFKNYLAEVQKTKKYQPIPLPDGADSVARVQIMRQ